MLATFGDLIVCLCGGDLEPTAPDNAVQCATCAKIFPYENGILITCGDEEDRATDVRILEEQKQRDKQAKLYDAIVGVHVPSWSEARLIRRHLRTVTSRVGLDVGCGTGRQTRALAMVSQRVLAIDRSVQSLRLCHAKLAQRNLASRVLLIQADLLAIPVRCGVGDVVVTAQVLQHLPTAEARAKSVDKIAEALGPHGVLIASLYEWSGQPWRRQKELTHAGGISAYRFTKDEVRALFSTHFDVDSLESCLGDLVVTKAHKR